MDRIMTNCRPAGCKTACTRRSSVCCCLFTGKTGIRCRSMPFG